MKKNDSPENNTGTVDNLDAAELGAMLREARSAQRRTLSEIASELRIRLVYLEAIEEGRLDNLPGPAYESGFLRAYGDYLGLDGKELLHKFKLAGVGEGRINLQLPSPIEEGRFPTGPIILVAAVLAVGAYGGWYYLSSQGRDPLNFVASVPEYITTQDDQSDGNQAVSETAPPAQVQEGDRSAAAKPSIDMITETAQRIETTVDAPTSPPSTAAAVELPPKKANITKPKISKDTNAKKSVSVTPANNQQNSTKRLASKSQTSNPPSAKLSSVTETKGPKKDTATVVAATPATPAKSTIPTKSTQAPASKPKPPIASENSEPDTKTLKKVSEVEVAVIPAPAQSAGGTTPANTANDEVLSKVIVRATADSWVEIRSGDNDLVLSKVLHAGEVYKVPPLPGLTLATGNAGGIKIVVDGRTMPSLGPIGGVRRNLRLDANSLLSRAGQTQ